MTKTLRIEVTDELAETAAIRAWNSMGPGPEWAHQTERTRNQYRTMARAALTAAFQHPEFVRQIVPEWLPIDSAPRDGSEVLLADSDSVTSGFYHDGSECYGHRGKAGFFCEEDRGNLLTASNFHATHWQPLPEPPRANLAGLLGDSDG